MDTIYCFWVDGCVRGCLSVCLPGRLWQSAHSSHCQRQLQSEREKGFSFNNKYNLLPIRTEPKNLSK